MYKRLLLCLLFLAACSPAPAGNTADVEHPQNRPTVQPPVWVESAQEVTYENVTSVTYLGRLDPPSNPSTVFTYALSPDSTRLVGLDNEELIVWDLITGEVAFNTSRLDASQVFYSPDKLAIYTVDSSGLINVYNSDTGVSEYQLTGHADYNGVAAYDANNGWLALGGFNGEVKVWDPAAQLSLVSFRAHDAPITALTFSPEGERLVTAGGDDVTRLWDWRNQQRLFETEHQENSILQIAFSPDGSQFATGIAGYTRLWSAIDGSLLHSLTPGSTELLLYAPDGRYLVGGDQAAGISLWNPADGHLSANLPEMAGERVAASFSPDGNMLLTSRLNGAINLWNLQAITGETIQRAALNLGSSRILSVKWTDDSRLLLFFDANGSIYVWGIGAEATPSP